MRGLNAFRQLRAGHPVPECRPHPREAGFPGGRGSRRLVLHGRDASIQAQRGDQLGVTAIRRTPRLATRLTGGRGRRAQGLHSGKRRGRCSRDRKRPQLHGSAQSSGICCLSKPRPADSRGTSCAPILARGCRARVTTPPTSQITLRLVRPLRGCWPSPRFESDVLAPLAVAKSRRIEAK